MYKMDKYLPLLFILSVTALFLGVSAIDYVDSNINKSSWTSQASEVYEGILFIVLSLCVVIGLGLICMGVYIVSLLFFELYTGVAKRIFKT